ncbi:hypothetical protein [Aquisphaera giovannonii]|nr:hypothetical protein [Aquisphaera giovannonii]
MPKSVAPQPAPALEAREGPHLIPGFRRSFDAPLRCPAVETGDPELDPLVSYLKASFADEIKDGHRLVIQDRTKVEILHFPEPYQDLVDKLLRQASDQIPADMIRDFCEKNRSSSPVRPEIARHLTIDLLSREEKTNLFAVGGVEGWKRFYAKFPSARGLIEVSRVGLNRDRSLALFFIHVGQAPVIGQGQMHVLKKEGGAWVELPDDLGQEITM